MTEIANFFRCKLYVTNNIIAITVSNMDKLKLINSYFNKYPLMISKYLNYLSYLEGLYYINRHISDNEISEIRTFKESVNRKIIYFKGDPLKDFYK